MPMYDFFWKFSIDQIKDLPAFKIIDPKHEIVRACDENSCYNNYKLKERSNNYETGTGKRVLLRKWKKVQRNCTS